MIMEITLIKTKNVNIPEHFRLGKQKNLLIYHHGNHKLQIFIRSI
jgi:hypothetical protein